MYKKQYFRVNLQSNHKGGYFGDRKLFNITIDK